VPALAELARRSVKNSFKRADRLGVRHVLLLGADELAAGVVTVKDLGTGEQERLARAAVVAAIGRPSGPTGPEGAPFGERAGGDEDDEQESQ